MIKTCLFATMGVSALLPGRTLGQGEPPPGVPYAAGFRPGGQQLFALDLSGTPVGDAPPTIKLLKGNVEVVLQGGVRMLKASTASAFLITLPQVLPQDFTLEFDLIPKASGPPPDLTIEGTPTINQGDGSAHLLWQADGYLGVIGGAQDNYETPMPEDLKVTLPGMRTQVGVSFTGNTVKLYTNGRRLYTLDRVFARGRVLRVSLGGVDDHNAVYLAGLRIATGAPVNLAGGGGTGGGGAGAGGSGAGSGEGAGAGASGGTGGAGGSPVPGPASLTATARSGWGVTLRWTEVPNASGYQLERSVPGQAFTPLKLQGDAATLVAYGHDDVTILPGLSYQYRVRASLAGGATSSYGPAAQYAAPVQAPQIQNLSAAVGAAPLPAEDQSGKIYYGVTYNWTRDPAVLSYEYGIEGWSVNPSTGVEQRTFMLRNTIPAMAAPPFVARYEAGTRGRFCVSVIREFDSGTPLPGAACVTTDIPPAGSASSTPGPASLIATARSGWGVNLGWDGIASAASYELERSVSGQAFTSLKLGGDADVTILPGQSYQYRVRAILADGTVTSYSPVAGFSTPAQAPQISNLTAAIGAVVPNPALPGIELRSVKWSWSPLPDALTYEIGMDSYQVDPLTGARTSLQPQIWLRRTLSASAPSWTWDVRAGAGWKHRFCVSVIRSWSTTDPTPPADPIPSAVCLATDVPSTPPPPSMVLLELGLSDPGTPILSSLCAPAQTSPGRGPAAITVSTTWLSPAGAELTWGEVYGAAGYVVERGVTTSGTRTKIASTCDNPGAFVLASQVVTFRDQTGGTSQLKKYTYVVHAYGSAGQTGWNSAQWTSPILPLPSFRPTQQMSGSTLYLQWDVRLTDPTTGKVLVSRSPTDYLVTSSYGLSQKYSAPSCACFMPILGVPIGTHTFTVTARWAPDATTSRSISVTVAP